MSSLRHKGCSPLIAAGVFKPIPKWKPPTGEPCAGEPHARFGGRGRRKPFPTPIGKAGMTETEVDFHCTDSKNPFRYPVIYCD
jgi:hypothetical protein